MALTEASDDDLAHYRRVQEGVLARAEEGIREGALMKLAEIDREQAIRGNRARLRVVSND